MIIIMNYRNFAKVILCSFCKIRMAHHNSVKQTMMPKMHLIMNNHSSSDSCSSIWHFILEISKKYQEFQELNGYKGDKTLG
jgi:hypothetical protein